MRLISAVAAMFILALTLAIAQVAPGTTANQTAGRARDDGDRHQRNGQAIFRYDTFGDEQLWTDVLRMHEVIATVPPATALSVGLKVDVEALPRKLVAALHAGQVDLKDPAVTVELLRLNAVVGVRGKVDDAGHLDQRRHHVRTLPLLGRQLLHEGHRQAAGWLGQHRSQRGSDRRAVAGDRRADQGRVQRLGPGKI